MASAGSQPNVILMMTDDMGWADVGFNGGGMNTPNLDAMSQSKHSIRFDNFYAGAPVCSPTRASVLTGRTPNRDCIWSANTGHLPLPEFTIMEAAKEKGYATSHFGKWHLGAFSTKVWNDQDGDKTVSDPGTHGADWWYSTLHAVPSSTPNCACFSPIKNCATGHEGGKSIGTCGAKKGNADGVTVNYFYPDKAGQFDGLSAESEKIPGDDSEWLYGKFESWLRSTLDKDPSVPFLSVIWWHPPHKDFVAMPAFSDPYSKAGKSAGEADYMGVITAVDAAIGKVRNLLSDLGVAENTMLFFTSDNGPLDGSPGGVKSDWRSPLRGYKHDLTEGGIRVPGILEWPAKISNNMVTDYPASTMDYLPTFLDAVGLAHPQPKWPIDGTSLLPLITGSASQRTEPIGHIFTQDGEWAKGATSPWDSWSHGSASGSKISPVSAPSGESEPPSDVTEQARQISWRVGSLKLYGWRAETSDKWQYALFDIHADGGENNNMAQQETKSFLSMYKGMWAWATTVRESQQSESMCLKNSVELLV